MAGIVWTKRVGQLLAVAFLVMATCIALGIWQIARLHQEEQFNAGVRAGLAVAPQQIQTLLPEGIDPLAVRYHLAEATGTYDTAHEIVLYGRTWAGQAGNHLLTPLITSDGQAIVVDRGWVPLDVATPGAAVATPPSGTVDVVGVLLRSEGGLPSSIGGAGATTDTTLAKIDLERIQSELPYRIAPVYLLLRTQGPGQSGPLPRPAPLIPLTNGPHLGYAIQWFAFAVIALVGFVILARRDLEPSAADTLDVG
jgi:surfeit locus 1 family protein